MRRIEADIRILEATLLAAAALAAGSCDREEAPEYPADTICVNTLAVDGGSTVSTDDGDNTFMVLFWKGDASKEYLETNFGADVVWPSPYLAEQAPQSVASYERLVYDTRYPYPMYPEETTYLYATGYAPGRVLVPETADNYRTLIVNDTPAADAPDADDAPPAVKVQRGRIDFLGCDVWSDIFRGSRADPFAQDKNKLYFRHLAAKLVFYADRDKATMQNKQFVRNVKIANLQMSIDGGTTWTPMYTPSKFEWKELNDADFTPSYTKTIETVKAIPSNLDVAASSRPKAGYKVVAAAAFAGMPAEGEEGFVLQKNATDRVPIDGMVIDSCYVCNQIAGGAVQSGASIKLKMNITALMSFDPNFPMQDEPSGTPGDGSGSTTDNLTFTKTWEGLTVEVKAVDNAGNKTETPVTEFRAGYEYRVYIHFHRTGVDLVARQLPWNDGGSHYIPIPGGDPDSGGAQPGGETGGTTGGETGGETGGDQPGAQPAA